MTAAPHEKFLFGTVFDPAGEVLSTMPRPKRNYSADEAETIRKTAEATGEARAMASIANRQAEALASIAQACQQALPALAEVAHDHRVGSAELALACGRSIAWSALDAFPQAPVRAALEALVREIEAAPRLVVAANAELAAGLQAVLDETAQAIGYQGAIQVRTVPDFAPNAFTLDFGDGAASFDPAAAAERVSQALHAALAVEGLHAEPLIPGRGAPSSDTQDPES